MSFFSIFSISINRGLFNLLIATFKEKSLFKQ